ncbi:hypothetical protein AAFC00_004404 [Neodothiora populina]|uniref:Carboxylic ester hydrolase n=1 Tax=Neodothiora populina TaxID=2781224 RepID=A0ABR3PPI3_9PEZI
MKFQTAASLLALGHLAVSQSTNSSSATLSGPIANITNGTIIGKYVAEYDQDQFLGIPFAQPPVGGLRFNLPQAVNETWEQPLNATEYGPICVNYPLGLPLDPLDITYAQSEDCLTLNVVRPAGIDPNRRLPVLVYIFGGGFQEGGSADGRYNTSYMVRNSVDMDQPTIMVTINYRLAGWGFLAGEAFKNEGLLNLAIQDQRLALRWIQENIEAFGGDKSRVTIQGESAGAISIGYHMLAYDGRDDGLFSAAICQSGGPWFFGTYPSSEAQETTYQAMLNATNCTTAIDSVACLRAAPFDVLNATIASLSFLPVVDGGLVPSYNSIALKKGNFVKVPLLIGTNTNEGTLFAGSGVNTSKEFRSFVQYAGYVGVNNNKTIDLVVDAYPLLPEDNVTLPAPYGAQFVRAARYTGDAMFIAGRRYTCELWTSYGVPCYSYRFDTLPADTPPVTFGAAHFEDVAFVFNNVIGTGMDASAFNVTSPLRERYVALSNVMSRMWVSFAGTHDPNNHRVDNFTTHWPLYALDEPQNIVLNGSSGVYIEADDFRKAPMKLLIDSALSYSR